MVNYWLVKSEPGCFSWSDQNKVPSEPWNGVRNYQARNNLASMKNGDLALFYHSVTEKKIVGVVEVVKESYPDKTFTKAEKNPWVCVDVKAYGSFRNPISLAQIKDDDALVDMEFLRQGRLSVVPVRPKDFERLTKLGEWECPKKIKDIPAYEEDVSWSVATVSTYINEHDEKSLRDALYSMRDKQGQLTQLVELFSSVPTQFIHNVSSNFTLPEKLKNQMGVASGVLKKRFFEAATVGLKAGGKESSYPKLKKRLVATVGAAGGAWLAALPADIILSTGLMIREIALIAQQEGFDIKEQEVIDACWDIYFLKEELSSQEAGKAHMVPARALLRGQSLGFLITDIVGKYGISVSRYTLHKLFPVAGALCGATLNVAFLEQYRSMAKIYFIMHRIKNVHGEAALEEFRSQFI